MKTVKQILAAALSKSIPQKALNILYMLFSGIDAALQQLEHRLLVHIRERNILKAQHIQSLRTHAAANGYEPKLREPSKGVMLLQINTNLFSRVGYPLFLPPYSIIIDNATKVKYYYDSNKPLKITDNTNYIPVVDGEIKTITHISTGATLERIYLSDAAIANNSITITVAGVTYVGVKSFLTSTGINNDRQFLYKFSVNVQKPIVLYVKNTNPNDVITISYRLSAGTMSNLSGKHTFQLSGLLDNSGNSVEPDETELLLTNYSGFNLGSDGTDENALRAAIGYNHGSDLLFDAISYGNYISRFSTVIIQKILPSENSKSICNIWLQRKQSINTSLSESLVILQYNRYINNKLYLLSNQEKQSLGGLLSANEYALSSHNIFDCLTERYAMQIIFDNSFNLDRHRGSIELMVYKAFGTFLHKRQHSIAIDTMFAEYMADNNVKFEYDIFSETDGIYKKSTIDCVTKLPILNGTFNLTDSSGQTFQLFTNINFIVQPV